MAIKRVWVFMAFFYNNVRKVYREFKETVARKTIEEMRIFAVTRIRGRIKHLKLKTYAQAAA